MSSDEGPLGKRWYSVRDACEYLGISQPTIFRWMKDGSLSYYKVGNSTRFSQEDLDAMVVKSTGQREAAHAAGRCLNCGHQELISGTVGGGATTAFRPEQTRFWTLRTGSVEVLAKSCTACGYVHLFANTAQLQELRPDSGGWRDGEEAPNAD